MAEQINQDHVTKINAIISEYDQIISNMKTNRNVKRFKRIVEVNEEDNSVKIVSKRVVEESSLQLLTKWRAPEDLVSHLVNLDEDHGALKLKIDFAAIRSFTDLEKAFNECKVAVNTFSYYIDSNRVTDPLKLVLDNLNKMRSILDDAQPLLRDEPDTSEELDAGLRLVNKFSFDWEDQRRKWLMLAVKEKIHPLLSFIQNSHAIIIDGWLSSRIGITIQKYELKYCASIDGFGSNNFHLKCDGLNRLLVLIHSNSGFIFGGFTSVPFGGNGSIPSTDNQSFLFTLTNPHNIPPTMYPLKQPTNTIHSHPNHGPNFGGSDIYICNNCNTDPSSWSNSFGTSYSDTTGKGNLTFTGAKPYGQIKEIAAFRVI